MKRIAAAYDTVASTYARVLPDVTFEAPLDLAMIAEFAREARSRSAHGARVLDAGCGAGRMIAHLEHLGIAEVEGADVSAGMVAEARHVHPTIPRRR
ncbi:methyltransferase domain-containing protein [Frondihabitans cladoniiphilus]|uniref:Methyltransferase domain-containing protein n=1 Tax=Frondihabitans cladoniiphilus TaxID=715785 RepID=A0ABP8W6X9_9MICO